MAILTYIIIQSNAVCFLWGVTIRSGLKQQFWAIVGVWPDSEPASLSVERKLVKPHGTDEGDVGGLAVQHVLVCVNPETRQLWKNVYHFVGFEIVDENVGHPKVFDEFKIHGHHHRIRGVRIRPAQFYWVEIFCVWNCWHSPQWRSKLWRHIEPPFLPLDIEVSWECDAVCRVIYPQYLVDVDADADFVHLVDVRKLELGIVIREANGFGVSCAAFEATFTEGGKKERGESRHQGWTSGTKFWCWESHFVIIMTLKFQCHPLSTLKICFIHDI